MLISVATYFGKIELENFFGMSFGDGELPEPHYNLRPGNKLIAVTDASASNVGSISEHRWGSEGTDAGDPADAIINISEAGELLSRPGSTLCIIPVSGFYMWKNNDEKDQPFFVRMMNLPFMAVAAVLRGGSVHMMLGRANTLVEPMSDVMPLVLNSSLAREWLQKPADLTEFAEKAGKTFFITDFTVLKVSKTVSDPKKNAPGLIQPLPK